MKVLITIKDTIEDAREVRMMVNTTSEVFMHTFADDGVIIQDMEIIEDGPPEPPKPKRSKRKICKEPWQ